MLQSNALLFKYFTGINIVKNYVFIATSLDGYIADIDENLDWLPSCEDDDFGYEGFIEKIDAIIMGTNTFNMVCSFDVEWPYTKPVFVVSNSITELPFEYKDKVSLLKGSPQELASKLHTQGYSNLYIDGGIIIQNFLKEDLIDELIITTIPILLGAGKPLFSQLENRMNFECIFSRVVKGIVQNHYKRVK